MMNAVFRVDASMSIGAGHLFRCLTLASYLRQQGFSILFACNHLPESMFRLVKREGFSIINLAPANQELENRRPEDLLKPQQQEMDALTLVESGRLSRSTWVIVDHYGLDECWEVIVRPHCERVLVIDDLGNRKHVCDILLDQNLGIGKEI